MFFSIEKPFGQSRLGQLNNDSQKVNRITHGHLEIVVAVAVVGAVAGVYYSC